MRSLIAFSIIFWSAGFAAAADGDPGPYWPNASAPTIKPKVVEYPSPAVNVLRAAVADLPPAHPAAQSVERLSATPTEQAPDPPPAQHADSDLQSRRRVEPAPLPLQKDAEASAIRLTSSLSPVRDGAKPLAPADSAPALAPQASSSAALALGGHGDKGAAGKASPLGAAFTVGGSLSIVLGLFLVVAWAFRKTAPRGSLVLPREVFEILGRSSLGARQQVQLLRCGSKLLLVSITPHGTETLTEVTDPLEVDRIAGICQQSNPKSSTTAFRQVFQQFSAKPKDPVESASLELGGLRRKRYRWEEKHA